MLQYSPKLRVLLSISANNWWLKLYFQTHTLDAVLLLLRDLNEEELRVVQTAAQNRLQTYTLDSETLNDSLQTQKTADIQHWNISQHALRAKPHPPSFSKLNSQGTDTESQHFPLPFPTCHFLTATCMMCKLNFLTCCAFVTQFYMWSSIECFFGFLFYNIHNI